LDTGTAFVPITAREYTQQLKKLESEGHTYGNSQAIARLDAQRNKSRTRGY